MTSPALGPTALLGQSVAEIVTGPIAPEVLEKAAMCLLDALGLGVIARHERTTLAMRDIATALPAGAPGARLWAYGTRCSLTEAVAANAVAVHGHFHDDSDPHSWCHPGSLIIPVAVGLAETTHASLPTMLRAIAAGYSTLNWLGAREHVAHALIKRGVRTSPALGTIGAAATASVMLGLPAAQATHAVAIATTITGGMLEPLGCGSDEWRVQNAQAARGGLLAAQLAAREVVGARTALEGKKGLLAALAGLTEVPPGWREPMRPDGILNIYAKPWATLGDNMAAVRAAKLLHDDGIRCTDIESIRVHLWRAYTEYPGTQYKGPFDHPIQALASTAFATAAMLLRGDLEFDVALEQRQNPEILALVKRIEIVPSDAGTKLDSRIELRMNDGRVIVRDAADAPRNWLYHDPETASRIFERRLVSQGHAAGTGAALATRIFAAISEPGDSPLGAVLDTLGRQPG